MIRLPHQLRAASRLIGVLGLTTANVVRYLSKPTLRGYTLRRGAVVGSKWAKQLNRTVGLRIEQSGAIYRDGAIFVSNHRSYSDIAVLMSLMECAFLAKAELSKWPILGLAARLGNTVFVDRSSAESRRKSRESLRRLLDSGLSVVVFPEGTSTAGPSFEPFRPGTFYLAAEIEKPVVPVAISYRNRDDAWFGDQTFVGHFLARFGKPEMRVRVAFGPPMVGRDGAELRRRAEQWIAAELAQNDLSMGQVSGISSFLESGNHAPTSQQV
jgi:1-acyl-sn-glycerol-3-phosphate acyltransferase